MILEASLNLLDLVYDFGGYRRGVVWVPLQPDVGRYQPRAVKRIKITPPPARGWYQARWSCSVRYNTGSRVSLVSPLRRALGAYLQYFVKLR